MSEPLRLPEGYSLEFDSNYNLVLKRADNTRVVAFEVSAFGPDPDRIMQIAWNDAEWLEQRRESDPASE